MSNVDQSTVATRTSIAPQRWFVRHLPANRRMRHAEEERQFFITSVVTRSEVVGLPVPDAVDNWASATSLAWLQEHRNDRPV